MPQDKNKKKPTNAKKQPQTKQRKVAKKVKKNRKKASEKQVAKFVDPRSVGTFMLPTQQAGGKCIISVPANLSVGSLYESHAALISYLLTQNVIGTPDQPAVNAIVQKFYSGCSYQLRGIMQNIFGTPALETRLNVVNDLIAALTPKSIRYRGTGQVVYSWGGTDPPAEDAATINPSQYVTPWGTWRYTYPVLDTDSYDSPAALFNNGSSTPEGAANDYSFYLGLVQDLTPSAKDMLQVVPAGARSVLDKDASSFSRVYSYCGLNASTAGGYYNDAENEVNITSPIMTGFSNYSTPDRRVPSKMTVTAGGPAKSVGIPLSSLWSMNPSYFNQVTPIFKAINLDTIVCNLAYWIINLVLKSIDSLPVGEPVFPFSYQDFRIMVRQALLASVFKDQFLTQFIGPVNYDSEANNFIPCMIMGHTYGNIQFSDLRVPNLLMENLSALQANGYKIGSKKSRNAMVNTYPVLGFYDKDTPPIFQIPSGEGTIPLFKDLEQSAISLCDGTIGGTNTPGTPVNLNGKYYLSVLANFNEVVSRYAHLSVASGPIGNCSPPKGMHLLNTTQQVNKLLTPPAAIDSRAKLPVPALKYVKNYKATMADFPKGKTLTKQSSKGDSLPLIVPPADVAVLNLPTISSTYPLPREVYQFFRLLVLPEIRLSGGITEDVLTWNMYQTITGESNSYVVTTTNPDYIEKCMKFGQYCVKGLAGGDNDNIYQTVLTALETAGKGGFLAGLLGGVAKSIFPGNDGTIDTIASMVPF